MFRPVNLEKKKPYNQVANPFSYTVSNEVSDFHNSLLVSDAHIDSGFWIRDFSQRSEIGLNDFPRAAEGNIAFQTWLAVASAPLKLKVDGNSSRSIDSVSFLSFLDAWPRKTFRSFKARSMFQIERVHKAVRKSNGRVQIIYTADDVREIVEARKNKEQVMGLILGLEGGHAVEGKIENLKDFFDAGVRLVGLMHYYNDFIGTSTSGKASKGKGLTQFGKNLINKMNELGMIIDISHSTEEVVEDVFKYSKKPVLNSHVGVNAVCKLGRQNLSDKQVKNIVDHNGLIAMSFVPANMGGSEFDRVIKSIMHTVSIAGEDHVCIGSAIDSGFDMPFDVSKWHYVTDHLLKAGLSEDAVRKIMGQNHINFLCNILPRR